MGGEGSILPRTIVLFALIGSIIMSAILLNRCLLACFFAFWHIYIVASFLLHRVWAALAIGGDNAPQRKTMVRVIQLRFLGSGIGSDDDDQDEMAESDQSKGNASLSVKRASLIDSQVKNNSNHF